MSYTVNVGPGVTVRNQTVNGRQNISSGGKAYDMTIIRYGEMVVSNGGYASNVKVLNGGWLDVYNSAATVLVQGSVWIGSGAKVNGLTISGGRMIADGGATILNGKVLYGDPAHSSFSISGGIARNVQLGYDGTMSFPQAGSGELHIHSGQQAINTRVENGRLNISGGLASGTVVGKNGMEYVYNRGSSVNTYVSSGGYQGVSKGVAINTTLAAGYTNQNVWGGGSALNTKVFKGAWQGVSSYARNTYVKGGAQYVDGGKAEVTSLVSGAFQRIELAGSAVNTTIGANSEQYVHDGYASAVTINKGGLQTVGQYGETSQVNIKAGGSQVIYNQGVAINVTVSSGGYQLVCSGGYLYNGKVLAGGVHVADSGAHITNLSLYGGISYARNATIRNTIVRAKASQIVDSNGESIYSVVQKGGKQFVNNGGLVTSGTINAGGSQKIAKGGVTKNMILKKGATQLVYGGGDSWATVSSGAQQLVSNGGTAVSGTIMAGGVQRLYLKGVAASATIQKNGKQLVSGGSAMGNYILAGGSQNVIAGLAMNNTISGGVQIFRAGVGKYNTFYGGKQLVSGGTVSGTKLASNGVQKVYKGRTVNTVVEYGVQYVSSGAIDTSAYISSYSGRAAQFVYNKGKANNTTIDRGATQTIFSGGIAQVSLIKSGGVVHVKKGGTANAAKIAYSGLMIVSSGGSAAYATVARAGEWDYRAEMRVMAGATVNKTTVNHRGILTLAKNATASNVTVNSSGYIDANGATLAGVNTFTSTAYNTYKGNLTIKSGATLKLVGSNGTLANTQVNAQGAKIVVSKTANSWSNYVNVGTFVANAKTSLTIDLQDRNSGYSTVLAADKYKTCTAAVTLNVRNLQKLGTYDISKNLGFWHKPTFTITQGATVLGKVQVNSGKGLAKNGVEYKVNYYSDGVTQLTLSTYAGGMVKGAKGNDALRGSSHSDIFYGGAGNDTITGINGRDVAVYDKTNWGKDTINATTGSMTLMFVGLNSSQISQAKKGKDLVITRKADAKQTVTIKNYDASKHKIITGQSMTDAMESFLYSASPTASVKKAAQSDIFRKAGLA